MMNVLNRITVTNFTIYGVKYDYENLNKMLESNVTEQLFDDEAGITTGGIRIQKEKSKYGNKYYLVITIIENISDDPINYNIFKNIGEFIVIQFTQLNNKKILGG